MYIYIILLVLFGLATLLFWAKWVNVSQALKNAQREHTKASLEHTKELKRLNALWEAVETIVKEKDKAIITTELLATKIPQVRTLKTLLDDYTHVEKITKHNKKLVEGEEAVLRKMETLRCTGIWDGTIIGTLEKLTMEYRKCTQVIGKFKQDTKDLAEKHRKALHVAHQKSYGYRKKLIKAGLLKPKKTSKK